MGTTCVCESTASRLMSAVNTAPCRLSEKQSVFWWLWNELLFVPILSLLFYFGRDQSFWLDAKAELVQNAGMFDAVIGLRKQYNSSYWAVLICFIVHELPDLKLAVLIVITRVGAICVCTGDVTFPSDCCQLGSKSKKSPELLRKRQYRSQGCAVALNVSTTTRPQGWRYLISVSKTTSNGNGVIKARAIRAGM